MLLPLPDGRWIGLTPEQLAQALSAAADVMPSHQNRDAPLPPSGVELLTAEEMEKRTSVPASWWLKQARERRIPHVMLGRYVRFEAAALTRQHEVQAVATATGGLPIRRSA